MLKRFLCSLVVSLLPSIYPGTSCADTASTPLGNLSRANGGRSLLVAVPGTVFTRLEKGAPVGVMAEVTDIILRRMGFSPVFIGMSMKEILGAIRDNQIGASSLIVMTPKNKDAVLFTDPVVDEYTTIVTRQGEGFPLNQLSDLWGRKIAGRQGYHYPMLEKDPNIQIERYRSDGEVIRNLLLHKVDLVLISTLSNIYSFRVEGVMDKLEILPIAVGIVPLRIALSPKEFSAGDLAQFNTRLQQLRGEPAWQDILARNGFADLIHTWPILEK
ncbi:MAG: transporter substrate-binding domain-containing protein [Magnetococcales bacterium]|nr:transporter substrate-binding domain-containing protein [Magnetococcales bacterium]